TPAEMTTMLTAAPKWIIPTLALKSFCGIRTEELFYLKWENIRFEQGIIWLEKKITKKKQSRAVPILPNLKLWLEPYRDEKGSVAERWSSPQSMTKAWSERAKHVGVKYKRNAMRNSYISYRLADTKKIQQVALESGNSPQVIQGEYWELVTEAEALAWFSIVPKST
ncbi:MAG: site-specific integrase, partial [Prosthecobacter sp.]|nr:site-specific integrase [Prosthecobacter sp.]